MAETSLLKSKLYAVLIGVDCYLPNRLPDGGYYPSLGGCVRDINLVEDFLQSRLHVPPAQILKLTATNNGTDTPPEPKATWPTYENIVGAFKKITDMAMSGEQLYIHYSGHGGRSTTAYPKVKGATGLDESLVPTDIGNSEARYVRDLEIAHLLKGMVDKGLTVTVVFDSCHSGGATRGGDAGVAVRGIPSIDTAKRRTDSLVASVEEMEESWPSSPSSTPTRSAKLSSGWLPEFKGGILLAACRADELANEFAFEGIERNGALTYWLLDSLKQIGPGFTFSMLHDRILAKVHVKFQQQTPQLIGDGSRVVFQTTAVPRPPSARVTQVDQAGGRIKIEAGRVQGITQGAQFAIYSASATDFTNDKDRLSIVEVSDVQDTESWASITDGQNINAISEGAQAVLIDAGSLSYKGRIRLVERKDLPPDIDQHSALSNLENEIKKKKWINLVGQNEPAEYQVAVNFNGEYEVWEPSGRIVTNLRPALKTADARSASTMADRLVHLTKFSAVKLIENSASIAPLARLIELTVAGSSAKGPGGENVVDDGEQLTFVIRNSSTQSALNVTVLDLQPDWSVTKIFPPDKDSELVDPGGSVEVPLVFELPSAYKESLETIKVFATAGSTSFDWLQLPALDKPLESRGAKRSSGSALENLIAEFSADAPPTNATRARLGNVAVAKWTTAQADVLVRRRPPAIKHVRDASTSLLQSAFEEASAARGSRTRSGGVAPSGGTRSSVSDPLDNAITSYFADPTDVPDAVSRPREGTTRGTWDTVKYCAALAKGMAAELWSAKVRGDDKKYNEYKEALTAKFGDCDPRFTEALKHYMEFLARHGKVPYRRWQTLSDSVIEGKLPENAVIGLVADWATGQPEALEVLRQVKQQKPDVAIHLGDIYYAGTATEVDNYFYQPWQNILKPESDNVTSLTLPGNHDLYAGGQPFYDLLDKLKQPASYFCLRNAHWQLLGLDTALNDRLSGAPTSLDPSELEWLRDKITNSENRRTVLLSHHQLFSTNDKFGDEKKSHNSALLGQVSSLLPNVDLWLWGHEHDLVVFEPYLGLNRGRCIGGSAFPVGKYEMPQVPSNPEVPYNKQVVLGKAGTFYQHCYAVMRLNGPSAIVDYYEDSDGGRRLFSESI